ncbi:MAG: glutamine synthetase type III, partial [Firmicutes bacterium]|nr:glutamine synthetase type III [Bacillota bacterium]
CQCELVPCYTSANKACDHNQLIMETLKSVADRQNLACLLHEKPFENINGSGKHNNWSLITDTDCNLFETGDTREQNLRFMLFMAAVIKAADDYNGLLAASVASVGNGHRLGGFEAPPNILTVYIGDALENTIKRAIKNDKFETDPIRALPFVSDRNRTSPFAFTGNKFEFRTVGSSASIADVNTALNTAVAESLRQFADALENSRDVWQCVRKLVAEVFEKHGRILFNGNNYSEEWQNEARKRNLQSFTTVEAIEELSDEKNLEVFEKHGILTRAEQFARQEIMFENYCNTVNLESTVSAEIYERQIAPTAEAYVSELAKTAESKSKLNLPNEAEKVKIAVISKLQSECAAASDNLKNLLAAAESMPTDARKARFCQNDVSAQTDKLRSYVNKLEQICPKSKWPLPTYGQLLFGEK